MEQGDNDATKFHLYTASGRGCWSELALVVEIDRVHDTQGCNGVIIEGGTKVRPKNLQHAYGGHDYEEASPFDHVPIFVREPILLPSCR